MDLDMQTIAFIMTIIFLGVSFLIIGKYASPELSENASDPKL